MDPHHYTTRSKLSDVTSPDSTLFSLALLFLFPGVTACPLRPGSWCPDLNRLILWSIFKPGPQIFLNHCQNCYVVPAPHFLLFAPWSLSHPGFPVFWTFVHCHSFELSFPLTVGSELLEYNYEHFYSHCGQAGGLVQHHWWHCTWTNLEGRDILIEGVRLHPWQLCTCPLPLSSILVQSDKDSFKDLNITRTMAYLACLLLPGLPWDPAPAGPPCSRSLSLNCKLLVPLENKLSKTTQRWLKY